MQKGEGARGGLSHQHTRGEEGLGRLEEGVRAASTRSSAPGGYRDLNGAARRHPWTRGEELTRGRCLAAAVSAPPAAASSGWNEENLRAEGSGGPPPAQAAPLHSRDARWRPHSRRPAAEGGGVSAVRRGGGQAPWSRPQPLPPPSPTPPHWTEAPVRRGGSEAGDQGCERHRGQGCSTRRFLRSEHCLLCTPFNASCRAMRSVLLPSFYRQGNRLGL